MLETLTVFEDVFVPWERVFACREPEQAEQRLRSCGHAWSVRGGS